MNRRQTIPKELRYTRNQFDKDFPNDDVCLEQIKQQRWPSGMIYCATCEKERKHYRVTGRMAYACDRCGNHVYPLVGTIFQKSTTPLRIWFQAMYLMGSTRCGISAKQIQRETGVTYKTAWRMFNQIRKLMAEEPTMLSGEVELDEAYIGGKVRYSGSKNEWRGRGFATRPLSRDRCSGAVEPLAQAHILPGSTVYADELPGYKRLNERGYAHKRVHHAARVYVHGNAHVNTIEGFWSLLKNGIRGVYHSVSAKYLQSYVNEYVFRYNHRRDETPMFGIIESQVRHTRYGRYGRYAPID